MKSKRKKKTDENEKGGGIDMSGVNKAIRVGRVDKGGQIMCRRKRRLNDWGLSATNGDR